MLLCSCFTLYFHLKVLKKRIPCIASKTTSHQANDWNADLHTQRQMSGNVCTFPSRNVLFQISSDHRIMFLLECGLYFTFGHSTKGVMLKTASSAVLSGGEHSQWNIAKTFFGEGELASQQICSESQSAMRETEVFPFEEHGRLQRCQYVFNKLIL